MITLKKNHWKSAGSEFSDPSQIAPLIGEQKKRVKSDPKNAEEWIKLGELYEERIQCISSIADKSILIRYCGVFIIGIISVFSLVLLYFNFPTFQNNTPFYIPAMLGLLVIVSFYIFRLRYPRSGERFFRKAIKLDPTAGNAHLNLGLIYLRRFQKRKAFKHLEKAFSLETNHKNIKRFLKSVYEKEFFNFFQNQKSTETKKQEIIDSQQKEFEVLNSRMFILKTNNSILEAKLKQIRSVANKNTRQRLKESSEQYENEIQTLHKKIESLEREVKNLRSREESDPIVYVNLGQELLQEEVKNEDLTFLTSSISQGYGIELDLWRTLSKRTRFYLMTAEQTYLALSKTTENVDFSLVGLEWCKALELEINNRFVLPFISYIAVEKKSFLKENTVGKKKNKPKYFSYLPLVVDEIHYPNITTMTLGQYDFLLKNSLKGEFSLRFYKQFLMSNLKDLSPNLIRSFQEKLSNVTRNYRNVIAHGSLLSERECNYLRKLLFLEEDALFKIIIKNYNPPALEIEPEKQAVPLQSN